MASSASTSISVGDGRRATGGAAMIKGVRASAIVGALSLAVGGASAQTTVQAGTTRPKADPVFSDLASFYASLPVVAPHPLDKTTALQMSTMPLSCMDHPQPRPNAVPYIWEATYTPV